MCTDTHTHTDILDCSPAKKCVSRSSTRQLTEGNTQPLYTHNGVIFKVYVFINLWLTLKSTQMEKKNYEHIHDNNKQTEDWTIRASNTQIRLLFGILKIYELWRMWHHVNAKYIS